METEEEEVDRRRQQLMLIERRPLLPEEYIKREREMIIDLLLSSNCKLTIVQVQLDVDIFEGEIEGFYREILESVDKLGLVIPSMDILDRITTSRNHDRSID